MIAVALIFPALVAAGFAAILLVALWADWLLQRAWAAVQRGRPHVERAALAITPPSIGGRP